MAEIQLKHWNESDQKAIRQQMDRIIHSGPFHQSHRRQRFLSTSLTKLSPDAVTG